jgi:pyruvate kinase
MATTAPAHGGLTNATELLGELLALRANVQREAHDTFVRWRPLIRRRDVLLSAANLAAYLALRRRDLRSLQSELEPWGVSSLGHSESHVMATLDAVVATIGAIAARSSAGVNRPSHRAFQRGPDRIVANTDALFGPSADHRAVRIMVTLPSEAAADPVIAEELVRRGMDCARINCAHDSAPAWRSMIEHVRQAARITGRTCAIAMDLVGRKVRIAEVTLVADGKVLLDSRLLVLREPLESMTGHAAHVRLEPDILDRLTTGSELWFNDGRVGGVVEGVEPGRVTLRITHARPKGEKLRADQGVNAPGMDLSLPALSARDLGDLAFALQHADIVSLSFVQSAADIAELQQMMRRDLPAGARLPGLIIKIETASVLQHVPDLIMAAAGRQPVGVMIARGDLAVEIGYERLAEIQEELLWVCEAAHVPVIWATEVFQQFVKKGIPSRAEVTDAAMAQRADCVMLNKGPHLADAVSLLDHVLNRMHGHQRKKWPQLRALGLWVRQ